LEYLIALLLGIIGSLTAWEISLRYRRWCEAIIFSAVRRLPDDQQPIRQEEWLAALNDCIGLISSFSHALGCWIGAPAMAVYNRNVVAVRSGGHKQRVAKWIEILRENEFRKLIRATTRDLIHKWYFRLLLSLLMLSLIIRVALEWLPDSAIRSVIP
jgi:hypothetical protein